MLSQIWDAAVERHGRSRCLIKPHGGTVNYDTIDARSKAFFSPPDKQAKATQSEQSTHKHRQKGSKDKVARKRRGQHEEGIVISTKRERKEAPSYVPQEDPRDKFAVDSRRDKDRSHINQRARAARGR